MQNILKLEHHIRKKVVQDHIIDSWRRAYPDIEFLQNDNGFSERPIHWHKRSLFERAAYVAYMLNPHECKFEYSLQFGGEFVRAETTDSERIWYIWMSGAMRYAAGKLPNKNSIDESHYALLYYATQKAGIWTDYLQEYLDEGDVTSITLTQFLVSNDVADYLGVPYA